MTSSSAAIDMPATLRLEGVLQGVSVHGARPADPQEDPREQQAAQMQQQLAAGRQELGRAIEAVQQAGRQFVGVQAEFFQRAEEQLLDLAIEIARKILAQEIDTEKYRIDPIVTEALAGISSRHDVVVRLNPADLAQCEAAGLSAGQDDQDSGAVRFVADPNVGRAECLIETAQGVVTSSIEHQLTEIGQALKSTE